MASLDAEWSRSTCNGKAPPERAFENTFVDFKRNCTRFLTETKNNLANWKESAAKPDGEFAEFLFKPTNWMPLGHADALCITLVDDLDASQDVIETYKKTVEEVSVGFCPVTKHLAAGLPPETLKHFVEPEKLFDGTQQHPLLFLARIKMQGVLSLGRALLAQESLYRLMAKRIHEALQELGTIDSKGLYDADDIDTLRLTFLDLLEEEEIGILFLCRNYTVPMSVLAHLQSLTFGDLQRHDKRLVKILDNTKHYGELFKFHGELTKRQAAAAQAARPSSTPAPETSEKEATAPPTGLCESMAGAHLLRWTRSTVAVSWPHFQRILAEGGTSSPSSASELRGFVMPLTDIGHPPGHQANMEDHLRAGLNGILNKGDFLDPEARYRLHMVGATDFLVSLADCHQPEPPLGPPDETSVALHPQGSVVPLALLLKMWAGVLRSIAHDYPEGFSGRNVSSWATRLLVPVPIHEPEGRGDWFHPIVADGHVAVIKEVLSEARDALFADELKSTPHGATTTGGSNSDYTFSASELRDATRHLGLPVATRRSLLNLYENFFSILSNPLLFDVVLDYYDVLATLYRVIMDAKDKLARHGLPESGTAATPADPDQILPQKDYTIRMPLKDKVQPIHAMLDSLSSALSLRQRRLYPETPLRDWSLDFRANYIQIILSAEAALKASVGLLRKVVRGDETLRDSLGVVHHITFEEGIRAVSADFKMGTEGAVPRLAIFASDIAHLTHVPGYADFFHEGFHLIYDDRLQATISEAIATEVSDGKRPPEKKSDLEKRFSELFVHLQMHLFVFDGDWKQAVRQHAVKFSASMSSAFTNPRGLRRSFLDNFGPISVACLVVDAARKKAERPGEDGILHSQDLAHEDWPTLSAAETFFNELLDHIQPVLADTEWIYDTPDKDEYHRDRAAVAGRELVLRGFMRHYAECVNHLGTLWAQAIHVHAVFVARVLEEEKGSRKAEEELPNCGNHPRGEKPNYAAFRKLQKRIDASIDAMHSDDQPHYAPLIAVNVIPEKSDQGYCMDATLVACRLLYRYCTTEMDELLETSDDSVTRFVRRNAATGRVDLDRRKRYSTLLLDRTATQLFSCVPEARRKRTGRQIATLKSFWDMASRNRSRRLLSLLTKADAARRKIKS
jgi:hypothetical protein